VPSTGDWGSGIARSHGAPFPPHPPHHRPDWHRPPLPGPPLYTAPQSAGHGGSYDIPRGPPSPLHDDPSPNPFLPFTNSPSAKRNPRLQPKPPSPPFIETDPSFLSRPPTFRAPRRCEAHRYPRYFSRALRADYKLSMSPPYPPDLALNAPCPGGPGGARPDSFPPPGTSGALSPPAVRPALSIPPSAPRRLGGIPPPTLSLFPVPSAAGARPPGGGGAVLTTRRCAHVILRPFPQAAAAVPLPSSSSSSLHPSKPTPRVLGGGPPRPPGPVAQSLRRVPVARPPRRTTPNPYTPPDRQIASVQPPAPFPLPSPRRSPPFGARRRPFTPGARALSIPVPPPSPLSVSPSAFTNRLLHRQCPSPPPWVEGPVPWRDVASPSVDDPLPPRPIRFPPSIPPH
jgi:hypothetical protein